MQTNLFIPKKIRVGFQERKDTFTGKLAYVIYYDEKDKIRKEDSWRRWCKKDLGTLELDNIPQSGYILNKGVQRSRDWGSGRSVIRVYDPRDFEFEIDVDNLIGILMHSDVSKRDIVEECIYAWTGGNLILLPVNSDAYTESVVYTEKQSQNVSAKDLIKGVQYRRKKNNDIITYIGFFDWWEWKSGYTIHDSVNRSLIHYNKGKKKHIFCENDKSFITPSIGTLSGIVSPEPVENYAFLVDKFFSTLNSQSVISFKVDLDAMQNEFLSSPSSMYAYPSLCKIERDHKGEYLSLITTNQYNCSRNSSYQNITYYETPYTMAFADSVSILTRGPLPNDCNPYSGFSSRYKYDARVNVSCILQPKIAIIVANKGYGDILSIEQYIDVMRELGYGTCMLELKNGNEIKFNL